MTTTDAKLAHTAKAPLLYSTGNSCRSPSECEQTLQLDMEAIFFVCVCHSLETLVVLSVVHGLQDQHVELFRVAAGTVAPWRGEALLVTFVRFLVMPMMLVMFAAAATVPQPSGATLSRCLLLSFESFVPVVATITAAAAKVARLKVSRRARDRGLDRVVRIVPCRSGALDRVALQDEAKIVPLVVQTGQLLIEVLRQREAERHLEPAAAGRTLWSRWRRDDRKGRRRRQTVHHPVGFTATTGTDLAVPVP